MMGYFYLSFLSPLERAHTRPFTGKERSSKTGDGVPARRISIFTSFLTHFAAAHIPFAARSSPLLSHGNIIFITLYVRPPVLFPSGRFLLSARRRDADETTRRGLFFSSPGSRAHQMKRRRDTDQTGTCA